MCTKITDDQLSVIVQGPVFNDNLKNESTNSVLKSIRKCFPEAEIILSTWEGSDINDLDFDRLILSPDPGTIPIYPGSKINHNLNRQILSTQSGLSLSTRNYVLKTRTDIIFKKNNIYKYYNKFKESNRKFSVAKRKILVANLTSVNPNKKFLLPFHPCDWVYFGFKNDIENLFRVSLCVEDYDNNFFLYNKFPTNHPNFLHVQRFPSESYIWLNLCKSFFNINMEHLCDANEDLIKLSEQITASNLIILNQEQIAFYSFKNRFHLGDNYTTLKNIMYTYYEFVGLYNKYNGQHVFAFDIYYYLHFFFYYYKSLLFKIKSLIYK